MNLACLGPLLKDLSFQTNISIDKWEKSRVTEVAAILHLTALLYSDIQLPVLL